MTPSETILLVDDEASVRDVIARMLRFEGFTVLEAEGVEKARQFADGSTIRLLITDVVMPDGGGKKLADELSLSHPAMRVLFVSGYSADTVTGKGVANDDHFLQKPFRPSELAEKVREALAAVTGRP